MKHTVTSQTLCVETLNKLEEHPFIVEMEKHYNEDEVQAFVEWFRVAYPMMATQIPGLMHRMGCRNIKLCIDQMLVTSFLTRMAGRQVQ